MRVINTASFSGGCFRCTEAIYKRIKGVLDVKPGYCGGNIQNPTYKEVCTGKTGHAETVEITYDRMIIDFKSLLKIFFNTHDPTTLNRQGNDVGTHYRSIAFYSNLIEKEMIINYIELLEGSNLFKDKIVTEVIKFNEFFKAENYHENYYELNKNQPYCDIVITPKVEKFQKNFKDKLI